MKKKKDYFTIDKKDVILIGVGLIAVIIVLTLINNDSSEVSDSIPTTYDRCLSACKGMSDSGGSLTQACHNNNKYESQIPNLEYFIEYCNCLKTKSEEECV